VDVSAEIATIRLDYLYVYLFVLL